MSNSRKGNRARHAAQSREWDSAVEVVLRRFAQAWRRLAGTPEGDGADLQAEFAAWEAASDEDLRKFESGLE